MGDVILMLEDEIEVASLFLKNISEFIYTGDEEKLYLAMQNFCKDREWVL